MATRDFLPVGGRLLLRAPAVAVRAVLRLGYRLLPALALMILLLPARCACGADLEFVPANDALPIEIEAAQAQRWPKGQYEVWLLQGGVHLKQGATEATSGAAVLWVERAPAGSAQPHKVIAYLEEGVRLTQARSGDANAFSGAKAQSLTDKTWFGRFYTTRDIAFAVPRVTDGEPGRAPPLLERGLAARQPARDARVRPAQFMAPQPPPSASLPPPSGPLPFLPGRETLATPEGESAAGLRRVRVFPRSAAPVQARWFPIPNRGERVAVIESGVNVVVDGLDELGTVDLSADRIVIWTTESAIADFSGAQREGRDVPLEFYLEGNIIFRQGDRVIYADRMYYNVAQEYGVVLAAEVLTPAPGYQGLLRLKADVLQQLDRQHFQAYGAAVTSSRLGVPRYWLQSQQVTFQDLQRPAVDPFNGQPALDPETGETLVDHDMLATSRNNFVYFGGYPIFYWPTIATDLTEPTYYIERIRVRNDSVFGFQLLTDLDAYQLLGIRNRPAGTKWQVSTDILTDRGLAGGTNFRYARDGLFGLPGPAYGFIDIWGLHDSGVDNLGADRRALIPEEDIRGRVYAQHRHSLAGDWVFSGELGFITDRNFLEEYYENEWDEFKDQTTGLELKRYAGSMTYGIVGDARINDFFTQTNWWPRVDHHWLGQDVFGALTYFSHSHAGYGKLEVASTPTDPVDAAKFQLLAWEVPSEGIRAATRHELDYPITLGPVKAVPYVMGEAAHWGQDLSGDDLTRLWGQAGVRASMPMWSLNRNVASELFNLNGMAHKVVFDAEFLYADANQDLGQLPLYDPLDDDATEHFRRRFYFNTFGGVPGGFVPPQFDERYFALRSALQSNVAAPSAEIADDLMLARFGIRQRWQTKRGLPGRERIVDWMSLDVQASLFPDPERDNFGEDIGLIDYDFKWHLGDRFTLLSDGYADLFENGLQTASVGAVLTRPEMGSVYVGYRVIDGPFTSSIISAAVNYRMSEKWIFTGGSSVDLESTGNIGQTLSVTRVGESLLMKFGFNYDVSRDNFSLQFSIEPRFLPSSRLGRVGGVQIPPAGALGLE